MAITVEALAAAVNAEFCGESQKAVHGGASLDKAGPNEITFVSDAANLKKLNSSQAGVVVLSRPLHASISDDSVQRTYLLVDDAQQAFIEILGELSPGRRRPTFGVSPQAYVSKSAEIGDQTNIYPGAYVGDGAVIGQRCDLHPGVSIGPGCRLGNDVTLHPNVVVYADVEVGDRVIVHASAVLGADGFGYRLIDGRHRKIPHFGTLRIENDVEIGACTTIDRAMIGVTIIGEGTKLDNQVMIAHNCEIGRHNIFVSQVGLAGSVTTGDYVVCAGQSGVADHVHLGEGCVLGGRAAAHKDLPGGQSYLGAPALPEAEARRVLMANQKLPELRKQLRQLETRVAELESSIEDTSRSDPGATNSAA